MNDLIVTLLVGIVGFGVAGFLLVKAKKALRSERELEHQHIAGEQQVKETYNWLQAYVGYYEYDGGLFVFLDQMRVTESDTPIEKVYIALEHVGAEKLVAPLRIIQDAYQECYDRTKDLHYDRDAEEIEKIEGEYTEIYERAKNDIAATNIKVYDLLEAFEAQHSSILKATQK